MYQRALDHVDARGPAGSGTAQKLSDIYHGHGSTGEHMRSMFHKRSPLAPHQTLTDSAATARFGTSTGSLNQSTTSFPPPTQQPIQTQLRSSTPQTGAVVPTGADLSSLYRTQPPPMDAPMSAPTNSTSSTSHYPPTSSILLNSVPLTSYNPPQMQTSYTATGPTTTAPPPPTTFISTGGITPIGSTGGVTPPSYTLQQPLRPGSTQLAPSAVSTAPVITTTSSSMPMASGLHSAGTLPYGYAPVGQSTFNMPATPVSTPMIAAPGLTPMGRDLEARSGSTGAPVMLTKSDVQRMQKQAAKEASRKEKKQEKPEKKKKGCCK
eukprot:Protomagalhaensia_wolfi_Nauph_80__92@NODE_1052_length_1770_cov_316_558637_g796_i0_p1_GENE_NODE_1052_length_1770_cov_316_558637_g796_i0NODE_1052_length_1770_cov_316_558637_g796_i0_p1_ORF_typecomplete_len322_score52_26_NODE_1052_length_1770_cov_316_558637_g796_i07421707